MGNAAQLPLFVAMILDDVVWRHVLDWQALVAFLQVLGMWSAIVLSWLQLVRKTCRQCRADIVRYGVVELWPKIIFGWERKRK